MTSRSKEMEREIQFSEYKKPELTFGIKKIITIDKKSGTVIEEIRFVETIIVDVA